MATIKDWRNIVKIYGILLTDCSVSVKIFKETQTGKHYGYNLYRKDN